MIGLRELAILAVVVLVLYGRSGVLRSPQFQALKPWISPMRRSRAGVASRLGAAIRRSATAAAGPASPGRPAKPRPFVLRGNRLFWFLTILAATAVAALIITRVMIASGAGPGITR